jgi:hypothetical protein
MPVCPRNRNAAIGTSRFSSFSSSSRFHQWPGRSSRTCRAASCFDACGPAGLSCCATTRYNQSFLPSTSASHRYRFERAAACKHTGRSFNGRTPRSGRGYRGSNPCLPASLRSPAASFGWVAVAPEGSLPSCITTTASGSTDVSSPREPFPAVDLERLAVRPGLACSYGPGPGTVFTVTREGDALMIQIPGIPKLRLRAESIRDFFVAENTRATVTFNVDGAGQVTGLLLKSPTGNVPAVRRP